LKKLKRIREYLIKYSRKLGKMHFSNKIIISSILLIICIALVILREVFKFRFGYSIVWVSFFFIIITIIGSAVGKLSYRILARDTISIQGGIDKLFCKSFYHEIHHGDIRIKKIIKTIKVNHIPSKEMLDCMSYKLKVNLEKLKVMPFVFSGIITTSYMLLKGTNQKLDILLEAAKKAAISGWGVYLGFVIALMYYYEVKCENEIIHKIELLKNLDLKGKNQLNI
jgi:hypothetical protein